MSMSIKAFQSLWWNKRISFPPFDGECCEEELPVILDPQPTREPGNSLVRCNPNNVGQGPRERIASWWRSVGSLFLISCRVVLLLRASAVLYLYYTVSRALSKQPRCIVHTQIVSSPGGLTYFYLIHSSRAMLNLHYLSLYNITIAMSLYISICI